MINTVSLEDSEKNNLISPPIISAACSLLLVQKFAKGEIEPEPSFLTGTAPHRLSGTFKSDEAEWPTPPPRIKKVPRILKVRFSWRNKSLNMRQLPPRQLIHHIPRSRNGEKLGTQLIALPQSAANRQWIKSVCCVI